MSDVLKSNMTAYQRWELPSFDSPHARVDAVHASRLPTAAEFEQMQQQAHDEGYQAGYAEGAQKARQMAELLNALDHELQQVDQKITQSLLDLALEIARQMVQQTLKVKPELLLEVVRQAIGELPHFSQHAHLVLHPADAELIRKNMGEQLAHTGWKIFEDAQMSRGGCRLETAHSQIDASLATRWKRVVSSIGQEDSWLES